MDVVEAIRRSGGIATSAELRGLTSLRSLHAAVDAGLVIRPARGTWALADIDIHRRRAAENSAVLSHLSAALAWGWKVKLVPTSAMLTVPRKRHVRGVPRARLFYSDVPRPDVVEGRTAPLRTVLDCARILPFDEGLAVADSALRSRLVGGEELSRAADRLAGKGCRRARTVARHASGLAANPYESVLRAICLDVPRLMVVPQVEVDLDGDRVVPDLVDADRRLVIEAESFEWHGTRDRYRRDVERYTLLTAHGWTVLRFTWEQVMLDPAGVRSLIAAALGFSRQAIARSAA